MWEYVCAQKDQIKKHTTDHPSAGRALNHRHGNLTPFATRPQTPISDTFLLRVACSKQGLLQSSGARSLGVSSTQNTQSQRGVRSQVFLSLPVSIAWKNFKKSVREKDSQPEASVFYLAVSLLCHDNLKKKSSSLHLEAWQESHPAVDAEIDHLVTIETPVFEQQKSYNPPNLTVYLCSDVNTTVVFGSLDHPSHFSWSCWIIMLSNDHVLRRLQFPKNNWWQRHQQAAH